MKTYQLAIFDLDGTLVNTVKDVGDSLNYVLRHFGKEELSYEQVPPLIGGGMKKLLRDALGIEEVEEAQRLLYDYYGEHFLDKTVPFDGVKETLSRMAGIRKAVCSNKPEPFTRQIVAHFFPQIRFEMVLGHVPGRFERKPSPECLLYIVRETGVPAEKALMVGDSTHDIQAARAAGIDVCAVTYGYRSRDLLRSYEPDYLIAQFEELLPFFRKDKKHDL